jgi:hypothetical protein
MKGSAARELSSLKEATGTIGVESADLEDSQAFRLIDLRISTGARCLDFQSHPMRLMPALLAKCAVREAGAVIGL